MRPRRVRLGRDRLLLLTGLAVATALCWGYVVTGPGAAGGMHVAGAMHHVAGGAGRRDVAGGPGSAAFAAALWAIMMAGMMLPSAAPMIVTYAAVSRRDGVGHLRRTGLFLLAYVAVWSAVSLVGMGAQAGLSAAGVLAPGGGVARPLVSVGVLLVAGVYQLSPIKHACLRRCRTPLGFLLTEWRPGGAGALRMGTRHGAECVLCCWAVMALMLVVGLHDLLWMGALTVFMLAEKALPGGHRLARASGAALLAAGAWLAWQGVVAALG